MKDTMKGPDFVCIGAERSGTTWLHYALAKHPELWLSPVKEIHYFNNKTEEKRRTRTYSNLQSPAFYDWSKKYYSNAPIDDGWYCSLFEDAQQQGLRTGESTTSYAVLDDESIVRMKRLNPSMRIIFIMKDPVRRAWSAAVNRWIKKYNNHEPIVEEMLARELESNLFARSTYINTLERFERFFSKDRLHYAFYENLCENPEAFLQDILLFLGVDPVFAKWITLPPTKSTGTLIPMPTVFEHEYAERILPSVERLCERFEGPPQAWRDKYRKLLNRNVR